MEFIPGLLCGLVIGVLLGILAAVVFFFYSIGKEF